MLIMTLLWKENHSFFIHLFGTVADISIIAIVFIAAMLGIVILIAGLFVLKR